MAMIQNVNPVIVSATIGIVFSLVFLVGLIVWRQAIIDAIAKVFTGLGKFVFNWKFFFWLVNIICMVFSAQNAGYFFGLYEPIGIALAFVLDLMIITFTQAMLSAKTQGDDKRAKLILSFIFLCAFLSTVGNLVHNLQTQGDIANKVDHVWFHPLLPYIGSSIPLFLVLLALIADLVTKANLDKLDVAEYEEQENKRVSLLEKRNEYMQKQIDAEHAFHQLLETQRRNKGVFRGAFRWPWEPRIDLDAVADAVKEMYAPQVQALTEQNKKLQGETSQFVSVIENLQRQIEELQVSQNTLFETQLHDAMSFAEEETPERNYPDIGEETEEETFYIDGEDLDESERDTDPNQAAVTKDETPGTDNITFLHSTVKPRRETRAKTRSGRKTSAQKAAAIIKNNPDITPAELSKKAKITVQYARRLLSQQAVVSETM